MLLDLETEPPDSSALTRRRWCGALSGILPVAGSAPRRWARLSAVSTAVRWAAEGGAGCAAGAAAVEALAAEDVAEVGAAGLAGVVVPESTARNPSMFLTSGSLGPLEATRQSRVRRSLSSAMTTAPSDVSVPTISAEQYQAWKR